VFKENPKKQIENREKVGPKTKQENKNREKPVNTHALAQMAPLMPSKPHCPLLSRASHQLLGKTISTRE
jgi:hypothetical protein